MEAASMRQTNKSLVLSLTLDKATMGVYPFMFSTAKDFEPIVEEMTKVCVA